MSWNYTGNPSSSDTDAVRFLVGDVDEATPLVQDEEIAWALSSEPNVYRAAATICDTISARYAKAVSRTVGGLSLDESGKYRQYAELAKTLRVQARQRVLAAPLLTQEDSGVYFFKGMHDADATDYPPRPYEDDS